MKVFSKSTFLRLPSFSFSSLFASAKGTGFISKNKVLSKIAPLLHPSHAAVQNPSQRLFTRYGAMVALLFFIGSITPSNAYSDGFAAGYVDLQGSWDQTASGAPLMADQEGYLTKVNPQTNAGDRSTMSDFFVHNVSSGETVSTIAAQYSLKQNTVLWANNLSATSTLRINEQLLIPPVDGVYHQVGKNDTVDKIAKAYSINSENVLKQNGLTASSTIAAGDEIFIPQGKPLIADAPVAPKAAGRDTPARVASASRMNTGGAVLKGSSDLPAGSQPFIYPTRGKITNGFHAGHYAFDIGNTDRPAIWAAGAGTVTKVVSGCADVSYRCGGGYGNHIIVDHGNGLKTLYAHLQYPSVAVGDSVTQGEVLGKMGRSGNVRGRTGIHLHFEVHKNGVKKLPSDYY